MTSCRSKGNVAEWTRSLGISKLQAMRCLTELMADNISQLVVDCISLHLTMPQCSRGSAYRRRPLGDSTLHGDGGQWGQVFVGGKYRGCIVDGCATSQVCSLQKHSHPSIVHFASDWPHEAEYKLHARTTHVFYIFYMCATAFTATAMR